MRILLVEDDRKAARLLARGLQEEGFVVDVVHSAEDGEEESYAVDYDMIVLDWMLPGKQGIDLCRDLRARAIQTPILMLTARDATADRVVGLNTGADDYLTKPSSSKSCWRASVRCCAAPISAARWCWRWPTWRSTRSATRPPALAQCWT